MDSNPKEGCNYLDGVPVRLSQKFWPLKPVTIPVAFDSDYSTDLLAEQYDFSFEKSVVKHTQKRLAELKEVSTHSKKKHASWTEKEIIPCATETSQHNNSQFMLPWKPDIILKPKSQQLELRPSIETSNSMKINLSDFESDTSSPFDLMELKTLNDLEELNSVFQVIHGAAESLEEGGVAKSVSYPLSLESFEKISHENEVLKKRDEDDSSMSEEGVAKSLSFPLKLEWSENYAYRNSTFSNIIEKDSVTEEGVAKSVGFPLNLESSASPQQALVLEDDIGATCLGYGLDITSLSQVPLASLRGSKSYSDISLLPEGMKFHQERSSTPPVLHPRKAQPVVEELLMNENHFEKPLSENSNDYFNHDSMTYEELDDSSRNLVDSIVEMGFAKGQVARAVKHLGMDEKKVVEHLCQIQALEESGYESLEAEAALHLHDYNTDQAKEFLDLVIQFQDLGFERDAVKKALVQNKNDWNKTIDTLLPN